MDEQILVVGDFYYDYNEISQDIYEISKWIKDNNYKVILNLEAPLVDSEYKCKKRGPNLSQSPISVDVLKKLNVVGVSLANNHIMDYGDEGLIRTIEILDKNKIMHTGAGKTIEDAIKPMNISLNGEKIQFFNFGWDVEETIGADKSHAGCALIDKNLIESLL